MLGKVQQIFGPEYKNPNTDTPKSLLICGLICLIIYVLVQASAIGTLGVTGVLSEPVSPLLPLAKLSLGQIKRFYRNCNAGCSYDPHYPDSFPYFVKIDLRNVSGWRFALIFGKLNTRGRSDDCNDN